MIYVTPSVDLRTKYTYKHIRMKLAISKARASGVGWVTAKRSNHFGICQWYTDLALEEGLIGMSATNTSPLVAPTRAKEQV